MPCGGRRNRAVVGGGLRTVHGTDTVLKSVRHPIVFVTDYGRDDAYASALTGAAWRVDPDARCVEGTHGIPAGDVLGGAYQVKALALAFGEGSVLCAVVDPDVGTARRAIAIEAGGVRCVAPDNGLISYLWAEAVPASRRAVRIDIPFDTSKTFHGRDVFAPAAARLAAGGHLEELGEPIDDPLLRPDVFAEHLGPTLAGRVVVVDHFGNAITTVRAADIGSGSIRSVSWPGFAGVGAVSTYADIDGGPAALIGSTGHLEIAARGGPVSTVGGPELNDAVIVELA
jgi:S-adenosylmethionine hydrolase